MGPSARLSHARRGRGDAPPHDGSEVIEIRTADGHALHATVREPSRRAGPARGVAILSHAMFARRSEFERAGFAAFLQERGWRTIAFDFRGHGDSGPGVAKGGRWSYEDLVERDLPAVVEGARARAPGGKVILVGHSLGGHVAMAAHATGTTALDGIALVASNVWLRACEPSAARWAVKRGVIAAIAAIVRRTGHFPARALRQGSDDEAAPYMHALTRVVERNFWGTLDGRVDYWDAIRAVRVPVYALASDGDPVNCAPECAARFALRVPGTVTCDRVRSADDGGKAPGHMELVTRDSARSAWARLEGWMRG